jgi:hypothetical protein
MDASARRPTLAGWFLGLALLLIVAGAVYVVGCVPLLPHPWPNGWEAAEDAPRVTIYEYVYYRLYPVQPLVGAD